VLSALGVVLHGAISQKKGDLVEPDALGLQPADRRDTPDVG
jgi:hypothetical protein